MKKILILLLIPFYLFSQDTNPENVVWVDDRLIGHVENFIKEGYKRNFDAFPFLVNLDSIRFKYLEDNKLGEYTPRAVKDSLGKIYRLRGNIDIHPMARVDTLILRKVVYHELAHACAYYKHSCVRCEDIMTEKVPFNFTHAIYMDDKVWKEHLDKLFKQIIDNLERLTRKE